MAFQPVAFSYDRNCVDTLSWRDDLDRLHVCTAAAGRHLLCG
jgi:hypothetical protein